MPRQVVCSIVQTGDEEGITTREGQLDIVAGADEKRELTERSDGVRTSSGSGKGRFEDMVVC